jgi:hypothetical protein
LGRFDGTGVVKAGAELPQIFTDLRLSDTLKWKEAVVIAEEYASKFLDTFIFKIKCSEVVISFVVDVF